MIGNKALYMLTGQWTGHFLLLVSSVVSARLLGPGKIGQMGFSGATAWWVHIHFELRNGKDMWTSEGLPSYFSDFNRILGAKTTAEKNGQIDTGDIVETLNK